MAVAAVGGETNQNKNALKLGEHLKQKKNIYYYYYNCYSKCYFLRKNSNCLYSIRCSGSYLQSSLMRSAASGGQLSMNRLTPQPRFGLKLNNMFLFLLFNIQY